MQKVFVGTIGAEYLSNIPPDAYLALKECPAVWKKPWF